MNGTPDYLLETTCLPWSALSVRLQFGGAVYVRAASIFGGGRSGKN
jgi:hypothetical protein